MKTDISMGKELLDAEALLKEVFPESCRPTVRWLRTQQKNRTLPFVKLGRLIFFSPAQVREAIQNRHTVTARNLP
jgi:hypothetical protein